MELASHARTQGFAWGRKSVQRRLRLTIGGLIILAGAVVMLVPLAWMASTSLKHDGEVFIVPIRWIPTEIHFENYPAALTFVPYALYYRNSVLVTATAMVGAVASSASVAFAFARLRAPGRDGLFLVLLATLMLPGEVTLVPVYLIWRNVGALDTYIPLVLPSWLGGSAFYIFLLRQFYLTLPLELDDAAKIDGASLLDIFLRIVVPLSKPALATVAIFSFFTHWNSFQEPLIYLNTMEKYTLPLGLRFYLSAMGNAHWNWLMAATLVAIVLPLTVFFVAQRYFVQGAVLTGLKG